jgi:predicted AlkP superfamily pyrophosphatase or phosphodiesterase
MKKKLYKFYTWLLCCMVAFCTEVRPIKLHQKKPQLTVIMVIDQFAYHYIEKQKKFFKYGIKELIDKGLCYENAYHPHGIPETSTGHNALSTGVFAKDHGIVGNKWFDKNGRIINYVDDSSKYSKVIRGETFLDYGKSCKNTMVDGLSDQFMFLSNKNSKNLVFSISLKDRAAIATANNNGKAIWFDKETGHFTSSKKYFIELPSWLKKFNKKKKIDKLNSVSWSLFYSKNNFAYDFPFVNDYEHASYDFKLVQNKSIKIDHSKKESYDLLIRTPYAGKLIFDLAETCITHHFQKNDKNKMILWVCVSNTDLLGHIYGPDSLEVVDSNYHLDFQIQGFMQNVRRMVGAENTLFVFTADHGIQPIQEIMQKKGFSNSRRILSKQIISEINDLISKKYDIKKIVLGFKASKFFLDKNKIKPLSKKLWEKILKDLKNYLKNITGIKEVWTYDDLQSSIFESNDFRNFYKNQMYKGRSGDLICMPQPYCLISNYDKGCSHNTPYDYDTHVPLILYQKNRFEKKHIFDKVWIPQLPVTLANILGISQPTASTFNLLPGIVLTK